MISTDPVRSKDGAVGYLTSALKACTWAVREALNDDIAVSVHGRSSVTVDTSFPVKVESYPFVQVLYSNRSFRPSTLTKPVKVWADQARTRMTDVMCYVYEGAATVVVYGSTVLEREVLSDAVIARLGASGTFDNLLSSNPWINIRPNMGTLSSPSAQESWGTPWDETAYVAARTFSFDVRGEFYYQLTEGDPKYITKVELDARLVSGGVRQ